MSQPFFTHRVFVDFENVPSVDLALLAGHSAHVTLLIGKNQKKFDLALVHHIHRLSAQIALVEVGAAGHNALDLTLSYYLGQAVLHQPDAIFTIVSEDKDFDPLVSHVKNSVPKIVITRVGQFQQLPFLPQPERVPLVRKNPAGRRATIIARLKSPESGNRPTTEKRLRAYIAGSILPETSVELVNEIIAELIADGSLAVGPTGRIAYAPPPTSAAAEPPATPA